MIKNIIFNNFSPKFVAPLVAYKSFLFGEPEIRQLRSIVPRGGTSIDVGAHHGIYTYFLTRISDRVVAFEPNPELATFLRRSVSPKVAVREVALGERSGTAYLAIPSVGGVMIAGWAKVVETADQAPLSYEINVVRLDDEGLRDVAFVKVDAEGHEEAILRGAQQTILRDRPVLLVEIEQRHLSKPISEIFSFIEAMDYQGYFLNGGTWRCIGEFESVLARDHRRAMPDTPHYLNNFLFWPKARGNPPWRAWRK